LQSKYFAFRIYEFQVGKARLLNTGLQAHKLYELSKIDRIH